MEGLPAPGRRLAKLIALAALLGAAAAAPQDPEAQRIRAKLQNTFVSVDFAEMPLAEFVHRFAQLCGENVVATASSAEAAGPITLKLTGVSLATVLRQALGPHGLIAEIEEGVLLIKKREQERLVLEFYDVRDLTVPLTHFPGVAINLAANAFGVQTVSAEPSSQSDEGITEQILIELIESHTGGDSWTTFEGCRVGGTGGGVLVVRQTPAHQRAVAALLARLRELR
jgi:hypothetical protein